MHRVGSFSDLGAKDAYRPIAEAVRQRQNLSKRTLSFEPSAIGGEMRPALSASYRFCLAALSATVFATAPELVVAQSNYRDVQRKLDQARDTSTNAKRDSYRSTITDIKVSDIKRDAQQALAAQRTPSASSFASSAASSSSSSSSVGSSSAASWSAATARSPEAETVSALIQLFESATKAMDESRDADAAKYLQRAVDLGNGTAAFLLGQFYEEGIGVGKDPATAARLYWKALARGDERAALRLGRLYALGRGVPENLPQARELEMRAAKLPETRERANKVLALIDQMEALDRQIAAIERCAAVDDCRSPAVPRPVAAAAGQSGRAQQPADDRYKAYGGALAKRLQSLPFASDEALAVLEEMIKAQPRDDEAYDDLASRYVSRRQWTEAVAVRNRALALDLNTAAKARLLGGNCFDLYTLGRLQESIEACKASIAVDPKSAMTQLKLADAQADAGNGEAALAAYEAAATLESWKTLEDRMNKYRAAVGLPPTTTAQVSQNRAAGKPTVLSPAERERAVALGQTRRKERIDQEQRLQKAAREAALEAACESGVPPPGLSADEDLQCKYVFVAKIEELVKAGRQAEADLGMERYFANYPTDTSVMPDLLADTYLGLRPPDLERAVSTRARVSRNRGDYTRLLTDLMLRDEWERADFYVGIALGIDPENPDYRARRESIDKALGKQPPAPPPAAVAPESKAFPNSAIAVDVLNKALELYNSGQRKEAVEQFLIAAEAGNTEAQMNLAGIYWQGDERAGYPKDLQKALKWMKAAAAQNQPLAISFVPMIEKELKAQNAPAK